AALFEMYSITEADEYMHQFIDAIQKAVVEIDVAVKLIAKKKLPPIRRHAIKIKDNESKCDEVIRVSIKRLFETETDPIRLIKYKEIYEEFENVADDCQNVANTFEAIIMKNA